MSSSEKRTGIHVKSASAPLELELRDHRRNLVAHAYGELKRRLEPGLYELTLNAGGNIQQRLLAVEPGQVYEETVDLEIRSTAPMPGTTTSHAFQTDAAARLSRAPTLQLGTGGSLMVYVRVVDGALDQPLGIEDLSLVRSDLTAVRPFGADGAERSESEGWFGFSAEVEPGGYALRLLGGSGGDGEAIDQSVCVARGWTTLVFLPKRAGAGHPDVRHASIHMARSDHGYRPWDRPSQERARRVEMLLSGLRSGNRFLPPDVASWLESDDFDPMLGILAAHVLLTERSPAWSRFDRLVRRLRHELAAQPDVVALHVIGKERRGNAADSRVEPVSWPPMLFDAYRGLIARDSEEPGLIVPGSPAERAASRLLGRGPWTAWRALPESPPAAEALGAVAELAAVPAAATPARRRLAPSDESREAIRAWLARQLSDDTETVAEPPGDRETVERVADYVRQLAEHRDRGHGWLDLSSLEVSQLSRRLGLPVSSVRRAIRSLAEDLDSYLG